jgi:hypothetical protein
MSNRQMNLILETAKIDAMLNAEHSANGPCLCGFMAAFEIALTFAARHPDSVGPLLKEYQARAASGAAQDGASPAEVETIAQDVQRVADSIYRAGLN